MTLKTKIVHKKLTGENLKEQVLISHEYISSFTKNPHHLKRYVIILQILKLPQGNHDVI